MCDPIFLPSRPIFQPRSLVTRSLWTGVGNIAIVLEAVAWSSGTHTDPPWTPVCTAWMKTWPPQPTASTRSLNQAPPNILLTPPPSTSCPALTLWQVSLEPLLHLLFVGVCERLCMFFFYRLWRFFLVLILYWVPQRWHIFEKRVSFLELSELFLINLKKVVGGFVVVTLISSVVCL